jgi:hypothetical protein
MRLNKLLRFLPKDRKFRCAKCPIPVVTCNAISKGFWGEERCLLLIVLREILALHTEEAQKGREKFRKSL